MNAEVESGLELPPLPLVETESVVEDVVVPELDVVLAINWNGSIDI